MPEKRQARRQRTEERTEKKSKSKEARKKLPLYFRGSKIKELSGIGGSIYKKVSQIYGIPLTELTPKIKTTELPGGYSGGLYFQKEHQIHLSPIPLFKDKWGEIHEELHSLQRLFIPFNSEIDRVFSHTLLAEEKYGKGSQRALSLGKRLKEKSTSRWKSIEDFWEITASPHMSAKYGLHKKEKKLVNEYCQRHGYEALLLLFACPPENYNVMKLPKKEKEFIEKGYLNKSEKSDKKFGITSEGIAYLKRIVPRDQIVNRLTLMQKYSERKGFFEK